MKLAGEVALEQLAVCQALEADWDLEGARPIDPKAAALTAELIRRVTVRDGPSAPSLTVGPDPDGGIDLLCESDGQGLLILVRPDPGNPLELVTREAGQPPGRQRVSREEAVERVFAVLRREEAAVEQPAS